MFIGVRPLFTGLSKYTYYYIFNRANSSQSKALAADPNESYRGNFSTPLSIRTEADSINFLNFPSKNISSPKFNLQRVKINKTFLKKEHKPSLRAINANFTRFQIHLLTG